MTEPEPKRPPPPKSYVPLLLLDEPTPALPPRPTIEGEDAAVPIPIPDSDPAPSLDLQTHPVPRPRTSSQSKPTPSRDGADSPVPTKPERRKHKKVSPTPPAPYIAPTTNDTSVEDKEPMSLSKTPPSSPAVQTSSPHSQTRSHTKLTVTNSPDWSANRPNFAPPDILLESLYTEVKKPKRYPAPNVPAPPPPYEGDGGALQSTHAPQTHNGEVHPTELIQHHPSSPVPAKRSTVPTESLHSNSRGSVTGQALSTKGHPRPMRSPPSRPSRPPAVSPPPGGAVSSPTHSLPTPHQRSNTLPPRAKGMPFLIKKRGAKPEITVVNAQPMVGDVVPSPPMSPQYDNPLPKPVPSPPVNTRIKKPPPRRPVSMHGSPDATANSLSTKSPSQPRKPQSNLTESQSEERIRPTRSMTMGTSPHHARKRAPPKRPGPFSSEPESKGDTSKLDKGTGSPKPVSRSTGPPRPLISRPPQPTSRPKKAPVVNLGPPPDEEPPAPPLDEEEHEAKLEEQHSSDQAPILGTVARGNTSIVENTSNTEDKALDDVEQPEGSVKQTSEPSKDKDVPVAPKRHSKFKKPTVVKQTGADDDQTKDSLEGKQSSPKATPKHHPKKRPPPPRPSARSTNHATAEDPSSSEKDQATPKSDQQDTTPQKPHPRWHSLKRPPPQKQPSKQKSEQQIEGTHDGEHMKSENATLPLSAESDPSAGKDQATSKHEQSEHAPQKPHPRKPPQFKRPPPPKTREVSNETKEQPIDTAQVEEPVSNVESVTTISPPAEDLPEIIPKHELPEQVPQKPRPKRPPTVKRPPPPKQEDKVSEETKEQPVDTTQVEDHVKSDTTISPTADIGGEKSQTVPKDEQAEHVPHRPRPKRPPSVKRPPPPKQEDKATEETKEQPIDTTQVEDHVESDATISPTADVGGNLPEKSQTLPKDEQAEHVPQRPLPKRPPIVKRPPPPKQEDKATEETKEQSVDTTQVEDHVKSDTTISPTADVGEDLPEKSQTVPKDEQAEHVPHRPRPKRPPTVKRPPPPKQEDKASEETKEQPIDTTQVEDHVKSDATISPTADVGGDLPVKSQTVPKDEQAELVPHRPRPKRPPTVKRPPPPKQEDKATEEIKEQPIDTTQVEDHVKNDTTISPTADVGGDLSETSQTVPKDEQAEHVPHRPRPKRPPTVKRPPPPKAKEDETSEEVIMQPSKETKDKQDIVNEQQENVSNTENSLTLSSNPVDSRVSENSSGNDQVTPNREQIVKKPQPTRPPAVKRPPPKKVEVQAPPENNSNGNIQDDPKVDEAPTMHATPDVSEPATSAASKKPKPVKRPPPPKKKEPSILTKQDSEVVIVSGELEKEVEKESHPTPTSRKPLAKRPPPPRKQRPPSVIAAAEKVVDRDLNTQEQHLVAENTPEEKLVARNNFLKQDEQKSTPSSELHISSPEQSIKERGSSSETPKEPHPAMRPPPPNKSHPPTTEDNTKHSSPASKHPPPSKRPPPPTSKKAFTKNKIPAKEEVADTAVKETAATEGKSYSDTQTASLDSGSEVEKENQVNVEHPTELTEVIEEPSPPTPEEEHPPSDGSSNVSPTPTDNEKQLPKPKRPAPIGRPHPPTVKPDSPAESDTQPEGDDERETVEANDPNQGHTATSNEVTKEPADQVELGVPQGETRNETVDVERVNNQTEKCITENTPEPIVTVAEATPTLKSNDKVTKRSMASKRVSGLTRKSGSSIHKKQPEEGGIRIIRYDKRETTFEASTEESLSVNLRDKSSTKPKPLRPVSMPPGKLSPNVQTSGTQRAKPGRPPSIVAEKPAPPSRPKPPKPAPPAGPERPKPPRPGPSKPPPPSAKPRPSKPPAPSKPTTSARTPPSHKSTSSSHHRDPNKPPRLPSRPTAGHPLYKYVCSEPHGLATTMYESRTDDELSYMEGDVIEFIEKADDNWYYARNADMDNHEGLVLARNLKVIKKLPGSNTVKGFEDGPCAIAMHNFAGQTMDELSFNEGDLIMLQTRVGDEWLRGKLINGHQGIFPKTFVEIVEDLPPGAVEAPPPPPPQSTVDTREPHCVAVHAFTAETPEDLSISIGDIIQLLERVSDGEWYKGRLGSSEGMFPAAFVEVKVDLPKAKKTVPTSKQAASSSHVVTATFDFEGQEGDLTFKAGDKITLTHRIDTDWVFGELRGKRGILPVSFIDSNPDTLPLKKEEETKDESKTGECESLFDFDGDTQAGELQFTKGEIITTTEWENAEWIKGRIGTREGMFPINFVKVIKELPQPAKDSSKAPTSTLSKTTKTSDDLMPRAIAVYDFDASNDEEISFKEGDTLYLLQRVSDAWYEGENTRTGNIGQFPNSYINIVEPLP